MKLRTIAAGVLFAASTWAVGSEPQPASLPADGIERELDRLDRVERARKKELAELGPASERGHARTVARARAYVRLARAGLLPVGGGFEALVDHASRLERLRRAVERDVADERRIAQRRTEIGRELARLAVEREPLTVKRQALQQARTALLAAQDRDLAFQRAFTRQGQAHAAVYGAEPGLTDPAELGTGIASAKGRLPFPLPGRAEIRAGRRASSDASGLEMRAPLGSPVRCVYPGRVAFADAYADYGNTVIVDHGGNYYSVSANLGEISVSSGDEVGTGARLGTVGDGAEGPGVYFELRHGAETIDASSWFGL